MYIVTTDEKPENRQVIFRLRVSSPASGYILIDLGVWEIAELTSKRRLSVSLVASKGRGALGALKLKVVGKEYQVRKRKGCIYSTNRKHHQRDAMAEI